MSTYPQLFRVRQNFPAPRVEHIDTTVDAELSRLALATKIVPGQRVAITAGSRGIANIATILKAVVAHFQRLGAQPFLVPAMGSHGGGTPAGQTELLAEYGITPESMGCPILASMDTVIVCEAAEGFPVHFDRHAFAADHVVVVNRIKPHTMFVGDLESGLLKMMLIGLGKHEGAKIYHRVIKNYSFGQIVRSVAREVISKCRILCGLAIVENAYDETARLAAVLPSEMEEREKELLVLAKEWLPRLPFNTADVLIVDEIGKNISGTGMDTNVIGRKFNDHEPRPDEWPKIKYIAVRGLTPETHGNAAGIGIAEMCLTRVVEQMDARKTFINAETAGHITAAMTPIHYRTDREMLDHLFPCIGMREPPEARLMWISNTLHLAELYCSAAYFDEARANPMLTILEPLHDMPFDAEGFLPGVHEHRRF